MVTEASDQAEGLVMQSALWKKNSTDWNISDRLWF